MAFPATVNGTPHSTGRGPRIGKCASRTRSGAGKRGGHPGHDQGRRLSIPQVVAPLCLSESAPRLARTPAPFRGSHGAAHREVCISLRISSRPMGVILWSRADLSRTRAPRRLATPSRPGKSLCRRGPTRNRAAPAAPALPGATRCR